MMMKIDAEKIRNWREDRCWSQEQLADISGVSLRTIQRIENGESVSRETVMALAAAFNVEPAALAVDMRRQARTALQRQAAKNRMSAALGFWVHLLTYIGVSGLFAALYFTADRDDWWFAWPVIGWGIGVFAHGATVLLANRFGSSEEEMAPFER